MDKLELVEEDGPLAVKSYGFALRIVKLYQFLKAEKADPVLLSQLVRCGTSVGANVEEAGYAQSLPDFISKLSIARKEAREADYWLRLLHNADYLPNAGLTSLQADNREVLRLLTSSIKTAQSRLTAAKKP